jgi:hypothetical protein
MQKERSLMKAFADVREIHVQDMNLKLMKALMISSRIFGSQRQDQ